MEDAGVEGGEDGRAGAGATGEVRNELDAAFEEGAGAFNLEGDEAALGVVADFALEVVNGVAEALEIFQGEVDAVSAEVFLDVPEDVGELHGEAEVDGVIPGPGVTVAENLHTDESDYGGDAVAV